MTNLIDAVAAKVINTEGDNRKAGITWGQRCGLPECSYLRRWVFNFGVGSVRVHHWTGSDDSRHLHDHSWWFLTVVVRGGYTDVTIPKDHCVKCGQFDSWAYFHNEFIDRHNEFTSPFIRECRACGWWFPAKQDHLRAPAIRFRPALHEHTVQVDPGGAWTIMLTGRPLRDWGFKVGDIWKRQRKYFREHGHHPCD